MSANYPNTPRINSSMFPTYVEQTVRVVGKVLQQNGERALLEAPDKGQVVVHMAPGSEYGTQYMEIIGQVNTDLSLTEMTSANFGNSFDLETYNEMIKKAQQFPSIF